MKLKHWMESLSRARKKSKNDTGSHDTNPMTTAAPTKDKSALSRGRRLSVKEIIMPLHNAGAPRERKYVRDNYPAVAAYLDHRSPLTSVQNLRTFRPPVASEQQQLAGRTAIQPPVQEKNYRGYERLYANLSPETIYATPSVASSKQECGCYRHQSEKSYCTSENCSSGSRTLNSRRVNIRTNPWIAPNSNETGSIYGPPLPRKNAAPEKIVPPIPPPKPQRKRPPPASAPVQPYEEEEDAEMVVCSDKSVGTDGDEYLFESSSCCDCDDCCDTSSCTSFSSLKFSSGQFFSTDTIQPNDSDTCSITSTPTILNDFDDADAENSSDRDSAVDSPGSCLKPPLLTASSSGGSSRRHHFSPVDSHTSWKYFDDDDEGDSGHGQTVSSCLGSPGSAGYFSHVSHSSSAQSANFSSTGISSTTGKRMYMEEEDTTREEFTDIDTNIDVIRARLQKQVHQLKHEQTALDWRMLRSHGLMMENDEDNTENMIEEDFIVQKKAILAETLDLLKRQLEEQNQRLQTSHIALQNLHRRQGKRQEPRNRDHRALSALYNENIRETFC